MGWCFPGRSKIEIIMNWMPSALFHLWLLLIEVSGELKTFLNQESKNDLCSNQSVMFSCVGSTIVWDFNGNTIVFLPTSDPGIRPIGNGAEAVLVSNTNGVLTSVLVLGTLPTQEFIVSCNQVMSTVKFIESLSASMILKSEYCRCGQFTFFNTNWTSALDTESSGVVYELRINDEVVGKTESTSMMTVMSGLDDPPSVVVTANNSCEEIRSPPHMATPQDDCDCGSGTTGAVTTGTVATGTTEPVSTTDTSAKSTTEDATVTALGIVLAVALLALLSLLAVIIVLHKNYIQKIWKDFRERNTVKAVETDKADLSSSNPNVEEVSEFASPESPKSVEE